MPRKVLTQKEIDRRVQRSVDDDAAQVPNEPQRVTAVLALNAVDFARGALTTVGTRAIGTS